MSENLDRPDIQIEGNVATWEIKAHGDINGTYIGLFKFKCFLDPLEQIKANRDYRELLGANPLSTPDHESFLAYALTQLKHRIISAPPFWASTLQVSGVQGNLPDENIISEVLNAAMDSEVKYRNMLKKKKEEALEKAKKAAEEMIQQRDADEGESETDSY